MVDWVRILILTASVAVLYGSSLRNVFVWDDVNLIVNNPALVGFTNTIRQFVTGYPMAGGAPTYFSFYYKPLPFVFFSLLRTGFGLSPLPFHLLALAIHIVNSILVYKLFKRFMPPILAFFLSLIFAVHPMNVEAVIYASALQDVLFPLFSLVVIVSVWHKFPARNVLILTSVSLALALLSKETAVIVLPILILAAYLFQRNQTRIVILGMLSASFLYGVLRFVAWLHPSPYYIESSSIMRLPLADRIVSMPRIVLYYITTFLFPKTLAISQQWTVQKPTFHDLFLPIFIIISVLLVFLFWIRLHAAREKGRTKTFLFFFVWWALGISVHLNIIPLDMTVAERWFYFPMVGLLGCIGMIIQSLFRRYRAVFSVIAVIVILLLSIRTAERARNWKNPQTLYEHDFPLSPDSPDLANALGSVYIENSAFDKALVAYARITKIQPDTWLGWSNLGATYHRLGEVEKAETYFKIATETDDATPLPFLNLAIVYLEGKEDKAAEVLRAGLTRYPDNVDLWNLLIDAYKRSGDSIHEEEARRTLERIIQTGTSYNAETQDQNVLELHR